MSVLLWFRNDLRTHDNPALHYFLNKASPEKVAKAIFFVSKKQWQQHHWSEIKIDFVLRHAHHMVGELAKLNIQLDIVHVDGFEQQQKYILEYCQKNTINHVIANAELEYNEQQRDKALIEQGVDLTLFESDVIVPKGQLLTKSATMFKVFTPFKRAWIKYVVNNGFEYLGKAQNNLSKQLIAQTNANSKSESTASPSKSWPLATEYEQEVFPNFISNKHIHYNNQRDIPSIKGTSGISPYLAAGVISPRYLLKQLLNNWPDLLLATDSDNFCWLNEIIWRDFYRHLLFHHQGLSMHQCFKEKYQNVNWYNNKEHFEAWKQGKTGYPIIDAAMRQLNATGWMHNRLRMLTASFLTKHLLIDWRWGEQYFMEQLIDGDLAANNGGWQWSASTGCDAQPYFRIFNPIKQSEKFDPFGHFIRMYIPELANIKEKHIHFPHKHIKKHNLDIYWPAIVEHSSARTQALNFYQLIEQKEKNQHERTTK
ncbi:MAG: deoxyribodipyrimidine photo-lyase [Colwellia sp.]|nr:deoxyribodipyrimidine photo-lyase [Colwellia sp.]